MKQPLLFYIVVINLLCINGVSADTPVSQFFDAHSVLKLTLPVNFKTLCRPRETADCDYTPTLLEIEDKDGAIQSIPIEIRIRGGWRALSKNCNIPLLFIRFSEQHTAGTPFEGQSLLPLTTHCGNFHGMDNPIAARKHGSYKQILLREYLGYRLYNLITDASLRVRLVQINYENPAIPGKSSSSYAFFTEHFKSLAARKKAELLPRFSFDHEQLDTHSADILALYQFMIGNTDWSIVRQRNTILVQSPGGKQVPVPYDLDMSGLVNAHYAGPAPGLPIDDVRERYYLGFCHPDIDWTSLFFEFRHMQAALLALPGEIPELGKKDQKSTVRYLKKFFTILNSAKQAEKKIINACHPWPPSPVDHTTPANKKQEPAN
jgi:hypothetical protein